MKKVIIALVALSVLFATSCKEDEVKPKPPDPDPGESALMGKLFINEVNGYPADDPSKNFELFNATDEDISLADFSVLYEGDRITWTGFPEDVIKANGYFHIRFARIDDPRNTSHADAGPRKPGGLGFSTGLSARNAGVYLTLLDDKGDLIDHYEKLEATQESDAHYQWCHARIPDAGKWYFIPTQHASPGAANPTTPPPGAVEMPSMDKKLRIVTTAASASNPVPDTEVTITAEITDVPATVITAVIKWKKGGADQPDITMIKNTDGDYVGTIPGQPDGTVVTWQVSASNDKGNSAIAPETPATITWTEPDTSIDYTKIRLNEISGPGEDNEKFYEFINIGTVPINMSGMTMYYNNSPSTVEGDGNLTWTGGKDDVQHIIEPNALLVLMGRNAPGSFTTGLTARGNIKITLRCPAGEIVDVFQRSDYDQTGIEDKSFSRVPDGTGEWYYTDKTPDATNGTSTEGLIKLNDDGEDNSPKLKLNEVSGVGDDPDKFYELINIGDTPINLEGYTIHYNANGSTGQPLPTGDGNLTWTGCADQVIEPGELLTLLGRNNPCSFTTGLTAQRNLIITLKDPDGNVIDQCIRAQDTGEYNFGSTKSFSRIPDGTGPFYFTDPTPDEKHGSDATGLVLVPQTQ